MACKKAVVTSFFFWSALLEYFQSFEQEFQWPDPGFMQGFHFAKCDWKFAVFDRYLTEKNSSNN